MAAEKDGFHAGTEDIPAILKQYHTIAVVGLSPDPSRASHQVAAYLQSHGYRIIPVNPQCREVLGEQCYAGLKDIPEPVEVVDIFRKVEEIGRAHV
jgi:predicted CoA-binding protein